MSWYYAGPEGKPIGPLSLDELQARRAGNFISHQTYVIEQPAPGDYPAAWRHYGEIFAAGPTVLPPVPTTTIYPPPAPGVVPAPPVYASPAPTPAPHPLFPSQGKTFATSPGGPVFTGAHPGTYHLPGHTNGWCTWGFGLGLASFIFLFICGMGILIAPIAIAVCLVGLVQVHKNPTQSGRRWAFSGLTLAGLTLLFALLAGVLWGASAFHFHSQTTTEQSTNDSDSQ